MAGDVECLNGVIELGGQVQQYDRQSREEYVGVNLGFGGSLCSTWVI